MRRRITALAGSITLTVGVALPALADTPVVSEYTVSFTDHDPCTGELHEITKHHVDHVHEHDHNFVLVSSATGSTDSGYILTSRSASRVSTTGVFTQRFKDIWHHPNGSKYEVTGRFLQNINTGTVLYSDFEYRCKSGPTVTGP